LTAFSHILGQQRAVSLLAHACGRGRLPHGLLFAGPAGVGKATTAAALAKLLLCQAPTGNTPCNECESCRLVDRSTQSASAHPDFHLITKELIRYHDKTGKSKGIDLSIQVIRHELIDPAGRKAVLGRAKVFVVHEADLMTAEAQNALLKTLEEPAGTTAIILLTDLPQALLPTVRSRCQLVTFVPLPTELIERELIARNVDKKEARAAAAIAEGSLGQALQFAADGIVQKAQELFSIIDTGQSIHDWLKSTAADYAATGLQRDELASKDQLTRQGLALFIRLATNHLRHRLRELSNKGRQSEDAVESTCQSIDSLFRAEQLIDANVNIPLALQNLSIDLSQSGQLATP
jgi:DNA polymerase-3 subunit delta'